MISKEPTLLNDQTKTEKNSRDQHLCSRWQWPTCSWSTYGLKTLANSTVQIWSCLNQFLRWISNSSANGTKKRFWLLFVTSTRNTITSRIMWASWGKVFPMYGLSVRNLKSLRTLNLKTFLSLISSLCRIRQRSRLRRSGRVRLERWGKGSMLIIRKLGLLLTIWIRRCLLMLWTQWWGRRGMLLLMIRILTCLISGWWPLRLGVRRLGRKRWLLLTTKWS